MLRRRTLLLLAASLCAPNARAAWAVIDFSNLVQNIQQALYSIQQYQIQVQQYVSMVRNLQQLDPSQVARMTLGGIDEVQQATRLMSQVQDLYGSTQNMQRRINERAVAARRQNMTWEQYLDDQAARRRAGDQEANRRVQDDLQLLQRVSQQASTVQDLGSRVTGTDGMQQSLAVLNSQVNVMLQQNNAMLRVVAEDRVEQRGVEQAARNAAAAEALEREKSVIEFERQRSERDRAALDKMLKR